MKSIPGIDPNVKPTGSGCLECENQQGWWFHLRRCAQCGHVGCCDSSPHQHARRHYEETGHGVIQSFEPGETWFWDFERDEAFNGPQLAAPHHHPLAQSAPGPRERVPPNWEELLHS